MSLCSYLFYGNPEVDRQDHVVVVHCILDLATTGNEAVMIPLESVQCPGFNCSLPQTWFHFQVLMADVTIEAAVFA